MKTYKQFVEFVNQKKFLGVAYSSIRSEAIESGFNGWLFDFYLRKYNKGIRPFCIKHAIKMVVLFCCLALCFDLHYMIKSITQRNETETLALVVDTCYKSPKVCKDAVITVDLKLTPKE